MNRRYNNPQETLKSLHSTLGDALEALNELPGANDWLIKAQVKQLYSHVTAATRITAQLQLLTTKTKGRGWNGDNQSQTDKV